MTTEPEKDYSRGVWGGAYSFDKGDVVKVKKGHPFSGYRGTVEVAFGAGRFGVRIAPSMWRDAPRSEITVHEDALQLD